MRAKKVEEKEILIKINNNEISWTYEVYYEQLNYSGTGNSLEEAEKNAFIDASKIKGAANIHIVYNPNKPIFMHTVEENVIKREKKRLRRLKKRKELENGNTSKSN